MENLTELPDASLSACENCQTLNSTQQKFCTQCSFPIGGTDEERQIFRSTITSRKWLLNEAESRVRSAKTIIYVLAGIFILFGLYRGFGQDSFPDMVVNIVLAIVFLIFAAWAEKNPFGAILTAFILYLTVQVVNAFVEPSTIFSGIILKVIFIGAFIKGIRSAQEAKEYMKELDKVKAVPQS